MAELVSPGVSISVSDESFYAAAGAGTVPLLIIATAQDKTGPDGTSTAAFTTKANAGKLKLMTSQRELLQQFGNPSFYASGSNQLNGYDLNEYGLLAAHSFLGLANRAYVLRADIDLGELAASSKAPTGAIADGSYWFDTASSTFGLREWSGTAWVKKTVSVVDSTSINSGTGGPSQAFGQNGDYAVVANTAAGGTSTQVKYYEKYSNDWYQVGTTSWGSATSGDFQFSTHLSVPSLRSDNTTALSAGDIFVQTSTPNTGASLSTKLYSSSSKTFSAVATSIYANTDTALTTIGTANVKVGDLIAVHGGTEAEYDLKRHNGNTSLVATGSSAFASGVDVSGNSSLDIVYNGTTTVVTLAGTISTTPATSTAEDAVYDINAALSAASVTEVLASIGSNNNIILTSSTGRDIVVQSNHADFGPSSIGLGTQAVALNKTYSNYGALSYVASKTTMTGTLAEGTYWYNATVAKANVDLLEHNGSAWVTFTKDVSVTATAPTVQSDGTALVAGDAWLDSDDTENFPKFYKWSGTAWVSVDGSDQHTAEGIVFGDFRQSSASSLDADAPLATAYPSGIWGYNKRASVGNVKEYKINYTPASTNIGNVWVDASGNKTDGNMFGLRKAVHNLVKTKMQSAIVSNDDIRSEVNAYNIIAAPGFPELLDEMVALSTDRRNTAFVIADSPFRLKADATSTKDWATNANNASENGEDGLVSASPYAAVYYPSALTTNLDGTNVVVPSSHVALRTLAYNDQVAFPWFAPAGFQRGLVQNATSVGYVDPTTGEYTPVTLNEGQRDTLYGNKINPIAQFPGRGLAVFGQKTLNPTASALDRVNVARLIVYIRERLDDIVKPFLFEPNDAVTRQNAKDVVDGLLSNLVIQRGLFDFVTVCDGTNNTSARIDRNELYIDIAIQPVKAVEFIYIPIRIQNTLGSSGS
jgi:hypothetical protein|tara:strand:+ start:15708 stop:18494 length:2787 start_codon:yes stop_codon:yes gene_type:complete